MHMRQEAKTWACGWQLAKDRGGGKNVSGIELGGRGGAERGGEGGDFRLP